MYKDIMLVAIDLDGTLLDTNKNIPKKNIEDIKKLLDMGIDVAIATGRPVNGFSWIKDEANLNKSDCYSITNTGSLIINNGNNEEIISEKLELKDLKKVEKLIDGFDLQIGFYNKDNLYNKNDNPDDVFKLESKFLRMKIKKFDDDFDKAIERISVTGNKEELDKFEKKYNPMLQKDYFTVRSMDTVFEVLNKNAGKGNAFISLCKHLGIGLENTLAMGDSLNDIDILELAKYSATTKNAIDEVKKIVDYVSEKTNDEAGVSDIIEHFFFK